jgi:hypothetical protein
MRLNKITVRLNWRRMARPVSDSRNDGSTVMEKKRSGRVRRGVSRAMPGNIAITGNNGALSNICRFIQFIRFPFSNISGFPPRR